jgi:hypothetical protein
MSRRPLSQQQQSLFDQPVELITHKIDYRPSDPRLLLEDRYDVQGSYSRGLFVLMAKRNIPHNFVFHYPDHPWFEDLYGLRKVRRKGVAYMYSVLNPFVVFFTSKECLYRL